MDNVYDNDDEFLNDDVEKTLESQNEELEETDNSANEYLNDDVEQSEINENEILDDELNELNNKIPQTENSNNENTFIDAPIVENQEEEKVQIKDSQTVEGTQFSQPIETSEEKDEIDDYLDSEDDLNDEDESTEEDDEYSYTQDKNQDEPDIQYKSKISAEDAEKAPENKSKPKLLNKKFILTVIVVVFCSIMLFTFITPTKSQKNKKKEERVPDTHSLSDYQNFAKNDPIDAQENGHYKEEEDKDNSKYKKRETQYDENGNVIIPPVVEKKKEEYTYKPNNNTGGGGSSTVDIPDTRNDSLQSKSILGIKGLTGSQERYSTDYQSTIDKNTNSTSAFAGYSLPPKEEYLNKALQTYSNFTNSGSNTYSTQNDQSGKNSFYNQGRDSENVGQGEWLDLNTIWQGTIFEATLTSDLNTDLPGEITARVTKNIYSSQDGRYLLIPQNSLLYGSYNSSISYSQKRVQVGWHTIVRPDGYSINIGNMNGTDAKGASGLKGFLNEHPLAYAKAIGLMSIVSIINSEFKNSMANNTNEYVQNIMANSQEVLNTLGEKLIERAMNIQPTIIIRSGTKLNIVANQNISLPPMEDIPVTQKYMRNKK